MPHYIQNFDELVAMFDRLEIQHESPGFYDNANFLAVERTDSTFLNCYASYVKQKKYSGEYFQRARKIIPIVANTMYREVARSGRMGASIDASMTLSRILESLGIWNYMVKGALRIKFPVDLNLPEQYFWPIDIPSVQAGHVWVVAPPYEIIDLTLKQQLYTSPKMREHLPKSIITESLCLYSPTVDDIVSSKARFAHGPDPELHFQLSPHLREFIPFFGAGEYQTTESSLYYTPTAITAPEGSLSEDKRPLYSGKTGQQLFEQKIVPLLESNNKDSGLEAGPKIPIYIDESGFTGTDLIQQDQPVFALASVTLSDEEAKALYDDVFNDVKTIFPLSDENFELKHSDFVRSSRGRKKLLYFFDKLLSQHAEKISLWVALKEYVLFCILIDQWVEWAFHVKGYNFYADDNARYFARSTYALIKTFESPSFLKEHLAAFQKMTRFSNKENYSEFWTGIEKAATTCHKNNKPFMELLLDCRDTLGYQFLEREKVNVLEITFTSALSVIGYWRNQSQGPFLLFHDRSSPMIDSKATWEAVTHRTVDEAEFMVEDTIIKFPLNVDSTEFVDSKEHRQIQFADLLAGATAETTKVILGLSADNGRAEYGRKLLEMGLGDLVRNAFIPTTDFSPPKDRDLQDMQQVLEHFIDVIRESKS